jgi:hypothetical protein
MGAILRIAYGRIAQETNALSPVPTEIADFRRTHWFEGVELHRRTGPMAMEAPGFLRQAELSGFRTAVSRHGEGRVETVPLLSAWAIPGGPLSVECFETLRDRLLAHLELAWPVDAVFLSMHGAMGAVGRADPRNGTPLRYHLLLSHESASRPRQHRAARGAVAGAIIAWAYPAHGRVAQLADGAWWGVDAGFPAADAQRLPVDETVRAATKGARRQSVYVPHLE